MAPVSITVTVDDEHLASITDVAAALRERGMDVEQVLESVGVISGSVSTAARASLDAVTGVAFVSLGQRVQLPPPDAPVQ